jgi:hypothetical protein
MKKNMILSGILFTIMASGLSASSNQNQRSGWKADRPVKNTNQYNNTTSRQDVKVSCVDKEIFYAMQDKTYPTKTPNAPTPEQANRILAPTNFPVL